MNTQSVVRRRPAMALLAFLVVAVVAALPTAGFGAVTIGSDLFAAPDDYYSEPAAPVTTTLVPNVIPGRETRSPSDGVLVRWRIKTDGDPGFSPFELRVITPPGIGIASGPPETAGAGPNPTIHTFNARLPIKAGQSIGVDLTRVQSPPGGPFAAILNVAPGGAASMFVWSPALGNGQARGYDINYTGVELLVNADLEPDADGDAYGDESQDKCKTDPFPAGGVCTAPQLKLGGKTSQRMSGRGVVVEVACPTEACTAAAKGTVAVPGAAKVYKLRPATKKLATGAKAKLKLKLAGRTFQAVKRAVRKRKRIKAKVTVTATDLGGRTTTRKRTIKLKK